MSRVALVALLLALAFPASALAVDVPSYIPSNCSTNTQDALSSFINAQPDGSTIEFPTNGCYSQNSRIQINDKSNLVIDGNGSEFRSSAPNDGCKLQPNWLLLRNQGVTLKDLTIVGNFDPDPSVVRSLGATYAEAEDSCSLRGNQFNAGISVYGGADITVDQANISKVYGDGVITAVAWYVAGQKGQALDRPNGVYVKNSDISRTARHGFSPNQGSNVWLTDSKISDCWYYCMDAELDDAAQELVGLHILRNQFSDYFMGAITVPVAGNGTNARDINIKHNVFHSGPDNYCNPIVSVGWYETVDNYFHDVKVDNNTFKRRNANAVRLDHVTGGSVQHNRDENFSSVGCGYYDSSQHAFARVTNSSGVTVADNGPAAAGATLSPPIQTDPDPPPPETCAPVTGLTASRIAGTWNIRVNFAPVPNATKYELYQHWSGESWNAYHQDIVPGGTGWGFNPNKSYDLTIKTICGIDSATSAEYTLAP